MQHGSNPITPRPTVATEGDHRRLLDDSIVLLGRVRTRLTELLDRVEEEPGALREVTLKHAELESALRRAFDAEERWNDWAARHGRGPDHAEIDFDAIRDEIACRIERLRDCCQE